MKDPLDKNERAYEILDVSWECTIPDVYKAYAERGRKNPRGARSLVAAFHTLRRPENRLEEDIWYYSLPDLEVADAVDDTTEGFAWDPEIPDIEIGVPFSDLAEERFRRDFSPLAIRNMEISHSDRYDDDPLDMFPIVFEI